MKYLNIAFVLLFSLCMISCGGKKNNKSSHIEDVESLEIDEDEIDEDDNDETDYIEAAITALEAGDTKSAVAEILNAVTTIKSYIGEMEDPSTAKAAITELTKIAKTIQGGAAMTADELRKAVLSLALFADDELDIDEEEIEN